MSLVTAFRIQEFAEEPCERNAIGRFLKMSNQICFLGMKKTCSGSPRQELFPEGLPPPSFLK